MNNLELNRSFMESEFNTRTIIDYSLVFILVATSGFAFFYANDEYIGLGLILSLFVFVSRGMLENLDLKFILILSTFILWELFQNFYFQSFELKSVIGTAARFIFAYAVIKCVGRKFIPIYINLIYTVSIISLFVYVTFFFPSIANQLVSHAFKSFLIPVDLQSYEYIPNYIIVAFNSYQEFRNSGPFWEPGAFSVFLTIALMLNILVKNRIADKKNILFIITIITTLSTAGFLALFVILVLVYFFLNPSLKKALLLVPMIALFTVLIINLPFMLPKIQNNIIIAENNNTSRFGSALSDYKLIYENPILGYGGDLKNMFGTVKWNVKKMHRNNGITAFITQWGLILFVIYFYNYKKSADNICTFFNSNKSLSYIFLISILLLGFSQGLFKYTFFHSLMFLQFAYLIGEYDNQRIDISTVPQGQTIL